MNSETNKEKRGWRENALPLAALFISLVSLIAGIYSQYVERRYKELSIEPRLLENRYPTGLYVRFQNKGVGPAEVTRIIYSTGQRCYDLRMDNQETWPTNFNEIVLESIASFAENVFSTVPEGFPRNGHFRVRGLMPSTILAVGEDSEFFSLYDAQQIFAAIGKEKTSIVLGRFGEEKLPFGFEYCSLTGKTCSGINMSYVRNKCSIKN
ncbi:MULTISPECIES: hypothetical protein [unclassified Tardiphaga]|jgi:hypothetical protein|uniref:hypothetical protein n=1 Tax=unclassified Tardiphaga TaxID=2631404 RepID=UPI000E70E541